ncbi:MAG TPA: hypothetical protein PK573_03010 [Spirochaetota bacterium]|nr:hypothetical protein [Spirochaetota bacterium]HRZ28371.1 hypothetical protein [Spirochaetota bacterium]HSA15520.1 hypothetical protein [Spirochaetota bacterium]
MKSFILYTGSAINLMLALFHMTFWKMLNWAGELPKLSKDNQGILQTANIIIIAVILYFAVMSFIMARRGKTGFYGKSIIVLIAVFYLIRMIAGYPFFGFNYGELAIWVVCLIIAAGYVSVLFMDGKRGV